MVSNRRCNVLFTKASNARRLYKPRAFFSIELYAHAFDLRHGFVEMRRSELAFHFSRDVAARRADAFHQRMRGAGRMNRGFAAIAFSGSAFDEPEFL